MSEGNTLGYLDAGLNEVEAWDGTTSYVRPGEYILEATGVEGGQSNTGAQKMVVTYEVIEAIGDKAAENADQVGRKVVQSYSLQLEKDGTRARLKSLAQALRPEAIDARGGIDPNALVGGQMACEIIESDYAKVDPVTSEKVLKKTIKVQCERHLSELDNVKPAPEPAPAPAANARGTATRGRRTNARPTP